MSTASVNDLFAPSEERLRRLRRMKSAAAGLLLLALALFVASYLIPSSGQADQFLRAASEAGMVGGLADWFAVTALFRRPLGLPIPHTALIPTKKDAIAQTLGGFLTEHFLDATTLADHLESVDLLGKSGRWLSDPVHATAVSREIARAASTALESIPAEALSTVALATVRLDLSRRSYAAQAGQLLELNTRSRAYLPLATPAFSAIAGQLRDPALVPLLKERLENVGLLAALWATDRRTSRLLHSAADLLDAAIADERHDLWTQLHQVLLRIAELLQGDNPTARAVDDVCRRQLDDPEIKAWLTDVIAGGVDALHNSLGDPDSPVHATMTRLLTEWGWRAERDEQMRSQVRELLDRIVLRRVQDNPKFFVDFITGTVAKWDAEDTSRRIETAVGRDLQFIRINGTVVGAVAGVAIHALSLAL